MMDLVVKSVIADRCGVTVGAVHGWAIKEDWPEPRGYASLKRGGPGSTPYWDWDRDILTFLDRNPQLGRRE